MRLLIIVWLSLLCVPLESVGREHTAAGLERVFQTSVRPFLQTYCLDCHGTETQEAKLDLSSFSTAETVSNAHLIWALILDRVEAGEMPPKDAGAHPTAAQRQQFVDWIHAVRRFYAQQHAGDPGPVLARRLNNAEYNNTTRDLTGIDIRPTDTFPVDPANEAGFDNSGESLTMSPALLNKYLQAARQVAEHLVLQPDGFTFAPHPVMTDTDRDKYCVKRIVEFYARQPADPADYFFAAWKYAHRDRLGLSKATLADIAVDDGLSRKYLNTVWDLLNEADAVGPLAMLQRRWNNLPADHSGAAFSGCQLLRDDVRELRGKLRPQFDSPEIEGIHKGSQTFVLWRNRQYAANRRTFNREVLIDESSADDGLSADAVSDDQSDVDLRLHVPSDPEKRKRHEAAFARFCDVFPDEFFIAERGRDYVQESSKQDGEKGRLLSAGFHSMMGYFRDDAPLYDLILDDAQQQELDTLWQELDFITSAPSRQYVGFLWFERTDSRYMRDPEFDFARPEDKEAQSSAMIARLADVYLTKAKQNGGEGTGIVAIQEYFRNIDREIRWVEDARLAAEPSHLRDALKFAERAFRRPLLESERKELTAFYDSLKNDDRLTHEEAVQDLIVSVLMSPHFCYRTDLIASGDGLRTLTDYELASRLSYFLWSSMPDAELLRAAASGTLSQTDVLQEQTRRMLQDDRVRGLATEFAGNWLDIRRFEEHNAVDRERFPEFDDDLRQAMFEEPVRFFVDIVQNDRSILDLLNADDTFVNSTLAKHYGVHDVTEDQGWIRLENAGRYNRGGLLPMAVFLTKNAPGLRTSPVKRGYWVVRRLLGERIPPPPLNVPELPADESKLGELTLRETLARHREHMNCAGCHERIDSFGLVFEGYGPIGELRETDLAGRPVDTSATFPGGQTAQGISDLRTYLLNHREADFVDNLCRRLLSYGLGRSLILPDELLIDRMKQELAAENNRFGCLVDTIITSPQFLSRK
ncbi:MAG: DUF1592 domain-containing protein [Planctomycetaceae bacterium]